MYIICRSFEALCDEEAVRVAVQKEVQSHGRKTGLEKFEIPGAITLVQELWTPESGLVTAAFKLKRKPIAEYYAKEIKKLYTMTN